MEKDECYNCKQILCESKFKRCDMCDFFSFCIECVPDTINFKVVELYVCHECVCNPDCRNINDYIDMTIEDLDITKSDFLKILKAEKKLKHGSAFNINKQIKRNKHYILKKKEMNEKLKIKLNNINL